MLYRLERSKMIIYEIDWRVMPYKLEEQRVHSQSDKPNKNCLEHDAQQD